MNKPQCDCCGSKQVTKLDAYREFQHLRCEECGYECFFRCNSGVTADLYENDADYIDDLNVLTNSDGLMLWHHLIATKFIQSRFQPGYPMILDVGCFNGFFVKRLLSLGYDVQGVDFNKSAIAYGQEKLGLGMRVSTQTLEELFEQGKQFDVITLFEVLEHLPDAKNFLGNVTKLLKDDGVLILSTPNTKMCWRPVLDFPPHHLSRYSIKSLEGYLSQLGLRAIYTEEQMSTYELVRHYVGTFFRERNNTSLRGGEFKHKKISTILRRVVNKLRKLMGILLMPIDKLLHLFGYRYISQVVVAEKHMERQQAHES